MILTHDTLSQTGSRIFRELFTINDFGRISQLMVLGASGLSTIGEPTRAGLPDGRGFATVLRHPMEGRVAREMRRTLGKVKHVP